MSEEQLTLEALTADLPVVPGFEMDETVAVWDDFVGTIVEAYFSTDAGYNSGKTLCLIATFESEEMEKPQKVMFACGDGWEQIENGEVAVRSDGAAKNFQKNSKVGLFVGGCIRTGAVSDMVKLGGDQFHAKAYVGLKMHIKAHNIDYGKKVGVQKAMIPVEYYGVDPSVVAGGTLTAAAQPVVRAAAPAAPAAPVAPVAAPVAPSAAPAPAAAGGDIEPEMRATLVNLADESPTHEAFMEAAFAMPGVEDNPKVSAAVMSRKPGSIWAVAAANK